MPDVPDPVTALTDAEIAAILDRAVRRLAALARETAILVPAPVSAAEVRRQPAPTGWYEIGELRDAADRFRYQVLWHPASGAGRLLRRQRRAKRGVLGEAVADRA